MNFERPAAPSACAAAVAVLFLYSATARIAGRPEAALGTILAVLVPGFSRLVFSGQPEMIGIALAAMAYWIVAHRRGAGASHDAFLDAAALAALGLSVFGRPEMAGFSGPWRPGRRSGSGPGSQPSGSMRRRPFLGILTPRSSLSSSACRASRIGSDSTSSHSTRWRSPAGERSSRDSFRPRWSRSPGSCWSRR
ncbi:MAG TPA: hypothetical protein DD417_17645 [Elusimicrobia bacterium]|nr:hypothetical protein [Elusimicrobiota bacterium]